MDTDDEETQLLRELRVGQLKEQMRESKARQLSAHLPGVAVTFTMFCAGIAVVLILLVVVKRILMWRASVTERSPSALRGRCRF